MLGWLGLTTLWAAWTARTDLAQHRIPNDIVLAGAGLALARVVLLGEPRPGPAVAYALVGMLALWPAWRWRVLGGGDVKLCGVVAAMQWTDFTIALACGFAGVLLLRRRQPWRLLPGAPPADGALHGPGLPFAPFLLGPFLLLAWWRELGG